MSKYNIYRVPIIKAQSMIDKFNDIGLKKVYDKTESGTNYIFYFSADTSPSSVWWIDLYKDFLTNIDTEDISNKIYFGALVLKSESYCYVISLGKTHFYLKDFCDPDFGIELGTRIIDKSKIDMKNSRLFGGSKKKSLTTYAGNTPIELDSGESVIYLKGISSHPKWGKKISCSSSVQFNVKDLTPDKLIDFIKEIEHTLSTTLGFPVPRSQEIKDKDKIRELDIKLINNIENNKTLMGMDSQIVSGVEFIFLNDYSLYLNANKKLQIDPDYTLEELNAFFKDADITLTPDNIDEIKIKAQDEFKKGFTKPLKFFIDYIDDENYFLQDGKWHQFNQNYIDFLLDSVNQIDLNVDRAFDFNCKDFTSWKAALDKKEQEKWYAEKYFNEVIAQKSGFKSFDREIGDFDRFKLEFTDLIKDDTLYFVKIGIPQKLHYVIDQSLAVIKYLQENNRKVEIEGQTFHPQNMCIWLILDRKKEIKSLTDLNSFIFHMKINEWRKQVINARYIPQILISYKVD